MRRVELLVRAGDGGDGGAGRDAHVERRRRATAAVAASRTALGAAAGRRRAAPGLLEDERVRARAVVGGDGGPEGGAVGVVDGSQPRHVDGVAGGREAMGTRDGPRRRGER